MSCDVRCLFKVQGLTRKRFDNQIHTFIQFVSHFPERKNFIHPIQRLNRLMMLSEIFEYFYFWFPSPFKTLSKQHFFFRKLLGMTGDDLGRLREYECILQTTRATESHAGEDDDHHIPNGQSNMAEFPTGR